MLILLQYFVGNGQVVFKSSLNNSEKLQKMELINNVMIPTTEPICIEYTQRHTGEFEG